MLLAKTTYAAGRGFRGSLTWSVNPKIDDALEQAFYKSFVNAPPTGKRFCFAFDVSGSMTAAISVVLITATLLIIFVIERTLGLSRTIGK